ncbi:hypothetical protein [Lentzea sp. CA-135723]|uniref:hypothetical protein n=1 Tax=Lentzea sp. CA-135723 TaxID=3239950 RepID=UPI003D8BDB9C
MTPKKAAAGPRAEKHAAVTAVQVLEREESAEEARNEAGQPDQSFALPERPSQAVAGVLLALIIVFGHRAAPAVLDPTTVPARWLPVVAWVCAVTAGAAAATLTTLVYSMVYFRDSEQSRAFLKWVAHVAGVGAALGLLLGLRVAWPLVDAGKPFTFLDLMSEVSNTATFMTLFMIAVVCWWRLYPVVRKISRASARQPGTGFWARPPRFVVNGQVAICLGIGNFTGLWVTLAVLRMFA